MSKKLPKYKVDFYYKPGTNLKPVEVKTLQEELRRVASLCFDELPNYQCLAESSDAMSDKIITVATHPNGKIMGFCSAVLLPVEGHGEVLHLGLTCVSPEARGHGLTHKLTSRLLTQYLLRYKPFGKLWITNVACVLSSLGNVAINFDDIFPSPFAKAEPSRQHQIIAEAISKHHREHIAIDKNAHFCPHTFVFQRSVKDTIFQKSAQDRRYHHRDKGLNQFYIDLMQFEEGDEVLQIGTVSIPALLRYAIRPKGPMRITAASDLKPVTA